MYLISIYVISFLFFQKLTASCDDPDKANICYFNYVSSIGIIDPATYNDYYEFVKTNYLLKSWDDIEMLCGKFRVLKNCVNLEGMNVVDFKKVPKYGKYSADYVGNFYDFDYMCSTDGNQLYHNSYECLKSQNIGSNCIGYATNCTSQINENICVCVNDAKEKCGSDASIYTNTSLFTFLCHSSPECCPSTVITTTTPILFSRSSSSISIVNSTTVIPSTTTSNGSERVTFLNVFVVGVSLLPCLFKFLV